MASSRATDRAIWGLDRYWHYGVEDIGAGMPHASPPPHGFLGLKRKPCFMVKSPIDRSMQDCKSESFHGYVVSI